MTFTIDSKAITLDSDEIELFQSDVSDFANDVVETLTLAGQRGEALTQEQIQVMLSRLNDLASLYS